MAPKKESYRGFWRRAECESLALEAEGTYLVGGITQEKLIGKASCYHIWVG